MATLQFSGRVGLAILDAIENSISTAPFLEFRTGAIPGTPATVSSGSLLTRDALPSDWMAAASGTTKVKAGTWTATGITGITTSNIGYFRIYGFGSPDMCDIQGDVAVSGSAMTVDNISIAAAQVVTINTFTLTAPNP